MYHLQYFDQMRDVMIRTGQLMMKHFKSDFQIFEKEGGKSLFTSVDIESENFLKFELSKIVPQAGFLAEESGCSDNDSDWMWVIDPLDGTRNFIKGIPHFCSMVALTYRGEPVMSSIYNPVTQEFYYAEKEKGLWLYDQRITFTDRLQATKTGIVISQPYEWAQVKLKLKQYDIQVSSRYFGCAGMDAIYLVHGNIDLIVLTNISWWDVAPGMLCIAEARGLMYTYEKSLENSYEGKFIAGNQLFF